MQPQVKGQCEWLGQRTARAFKRFWKRFTNKQERLKAKKNPECDTSYGKHSGYWD